MPSNERRHRPHLRRAITLLLGPDADPLSQAQLLFALTATAFILIALIFNVIAGTADPRLNWIYAGLMPVHAWLWYQGRWYGRLRLTTNGILIVLSFIALPSNWVFNAGSHGPTLLVSTIALAYSVGVHQRHDPVLRLAQGGLVLMPAVMLAIEHRFPEWIFQYRHPSDRYGDLIISYVLSSVSLGVLIMGHTRRFRQELQRADELAEQLRELARRDSLTQLLNHHSILEVVQQRLSGRLPVTLYLADIDHFKRINDEYGHQTGDAILRALSEQMLEACATMNAQAGRLGGEEFLLMVPGGVDQALVLDRKLRSALDRRTDLVCPVTFSAGLAEWQPGQSLDRLIHRADTTLYAAKDAGRNRSNVAPGGP